jgi:hypothetical protein
MGRPPGSKNAEPRRVESQTRMTVAEVDPVATEPVMRVAEEIPPLVTTYSDPEIVELFLDGVRIVPDDFPPVDPNPYRPMADALQDGTLLEARDADGSEFLMVWRRTSKFNARAGKWEKTGFWSSHLTRQPLALKPVEWRVAEGFNAPGMVVA